MNPIDACNIKHRWCDELSAVAGALYALEQEYAANVDKLWVYKCQYCRGWHLTKREQPGREPVTLNKGD